VAEVLEHHLAVYGGDPRTGKSAMARLIVDHEMYEALTDAEQADLLAVQMPRMVHEVYRQARLDGFALGADAVWAGFEGGFRMAYGLAIALN
jgi:hypothetical protein